MCPSKLFRENMIRAGLVDWIEILSLDILHEGDLETLFIAKFDYYCWNFFHSNALCRTKPSVTSDQFVTLADRSQ
jgi:hypothetical protein